MQETVGIVQKDDGLTRLFRELRIEKDTGARTAVRHLIETFGQGTSQRALGRSLRDGTMYEILRSDGIELVNWIGDPKFLFTSPIATDRKVNALVYGSDSEPCDTTPDSEVPGPGRWETRAARHGGLRGPGPGPCVMAKSESV